MQEATHGTISRVSMPPLVHSGMVTTQQAGGVLQARQLAGGQEKDGPVFSQ